MKDTKIPVIIDHDGSADDFLSLVLLLSMEQYDVKAITITPADCYIENALETTLKILKKAGRNDIPVGISYCRGENSFPADWRAKPKILNALPDLINVEVTSTLANHKNAVDLIIETLIASDDKAKILMTGPCTNLTDALTKRPSIKEKINEVVWMGGAFRVRGNVVTYNHDNSAEWNVFWDPKAAAKMLDFNLPLTFIPLDVTNHVPVTLDFLKELAKFNDILWARLACQFWATTLDTVPSYEYTYFMWDVLATSYLGIPDAFEVQENMECVIESSGPSAGRTSIEKGTGKYAHIAIDVDKAKFYNYVLKAFIEF